MTHKSALKNGKTSQTVTKNCGGYNPLSERICAENCRTVCGGFISAPEAGLKMYLLNKKRGGYTKVIFDLFLEGYPPKKTFTFLPSDKPAVCRKNCRKSCGGLRQFSAAN